MSDSPGPPRICVVGSINMDLVVRSPRLPGAGETLLGGPFQSFPGGKGANQAVAAARLGAQVAFVGAVGDDAHGRAMLDVLKSEGVDVALVATRPGMATGVALITVADAAADNTIVVAPGANASLTPSDLDAARPVLAAADLVLMQLEVPVAAVSRAAELARDSGTTVVLNAAPASRLPADLLAATDALIVNENEAAMVGTAFAMTQSEGDELDALLARVKALGTMTTVLTAGPRGALFTHGRDEPGRVAAFCVDAIDTVGAGDAFCGAFATRLAEHQISGARGGPDRLAIMDTVCWANAAGALATTRHGAIPSLPARTEVLRLLRSRE